MEVSSRSGVAGVNAASVCLLTFSSLASPSVSVPTVVITEKSVPAQ